MNATLLLSLVGAPILGAQVAVSEIPDGRAAIAAALAAHPDGASAEAVGVFAGSAPRELFRGLGDDNVASLLVRPDADGDGVSEIVTGWDIFKTGDNLTVSTGAGFLTDQHVWALETQDGISGGYFAGQEALTTLPDSTGDGVDEFIGCTGGGGRSATVYDGATGGVLQSFDTYLGTDSGWVYAACVVGDVNGNGTPDFAIAVGSDDDAVYMVDGGSRGVHHDEIWRHAGPDAFYGVVSVGDIDGDGVTDVVAGAGDNADVVRALSGADGSPLWNEPLIAVWHLLAYPDRNGDGVDEVIVASWQALGARMLDGRTGADVWTANVASTLVYRVVPVGDVDDDGLADVAVAASSGGCVVLAGSDGAELWRRDPPDLVWAVDPVGDVTGDGIAEVAWGDFDGFTTLSDGADGSTLWVHSTNDHKVLQLRGAPDLDGDGAPEVVIGAQQLSSLVEPMLFVVDADSEGVAGGPQLEPHGAYALGANVPLTLTDAVPGHVAWTVLGLDPALVPFGNKGTFAVDPGFFAILFAVAVPPGGTLPTPFDLPADPLLEGLFLYLQTFVLTPTSPASGASSNRIGLALTS